MILLNQRRHHDTTLNQESNVESGMPAFNIELGSVSVSNSSGSRAISSTQYSHTRPFPKSLKPSNLGDVGALGDSIVSLPEIEFADPPYTNKEVANVKAELNPQSL
ncbi:hypothetical protein AN958_10308 [Leucoagaricus sp. SymC.cos]|nr:hypothetical protein AN958_10308 [Leucoagaricus sp. SymC.cos]